MMKVFLASFLFVSSPTAAMALNLGFRITGNNVQVTEPLRTYSESKLGKPLDRHVDFLTSADLHLKVEHRAGGLHDTEHKGTGAHIAELTAHCKDKQIIRVTAECEDMYESLDALTEKLSRQLRKYKERKQDRRSKRGVNSEAGLEEDDDEEGEAYELEADTKSSDVVRTKSFPMPDSSVEEAIMCMEYLEHDFYVFRNEDTKEVNVVYQRKSGGVGLIAPED